MKYKYLAIIAIAVITMFIIVSFSGITYKKDLNTISEKPKTNKINNYVKNRKYYIHA